MILKRKKSVRVLSMVFMMIFLLSNIKPTVITAANTFTVPTNALQLANKLVAANPDISIVSGTVTNKGKLTASSIFTELNLGTMSGVSYSLPDGILITSGNGTPPKSNTKSNYTVQNSTPGDTDVETMAGVLDSKDAFALEFQFTVPEGKNAVEFIFMFGSDEFPEYLNDIVDGAAVIIDGVNYAKFPGNVPLKVVTEAKLNKNINLAIEYNGISAPQKIIALLDMEREIHTAKIVIADTKDEKYDSGLFISSMKPTYATSGGIVDNIPSPEVISVSVSPKVVDVLLGTSTTLSANVTVSDGADTAVVWTSYDETGKVTVDSNGQVTVAADATPGNYIIKATSVADETKSDTATITVKEAAAIKSVTVTPKTSTAFKGETKQLHAEVLVTGEANTSVNWMSYDETGKVTVDNKGLVTVAADVTPGNYMIKATSVVDETKSDTATVTVKEIPAVNSVTVIPKTATIVIGESKQLQVDVLVTGEADTSVTSTSYDETGKVTVDNYGQVYVAQDAIPGNYVIKVTSVIDETKSDTATITVKLPDGVNSVTISPKTTTLYLGETQQFQVAVDVIGEVDNSVNWTCYDETGKVTVDNNGLVSVAADAIPGNYIIKATSLADESMSDTATVTVKEIPSITSVSVNPKTSTIVKGGAQQLQADVIVKGDADKTVIWSTNDETGKVSVDGNGQVSVASDATVGDYFIKATSLIDESKFDTATVTVKEVASVTSVTVKPKTFTIVKGGSLQLQAEVIAKGDADKGVTWSTYDETGKVTVNDNGKVSVASDAEIGEYIIKATSVFDSLKYDTAKIIVKIADTNIENPIPNTPEEEVEEKTVTVVEVPEGISNPNKIQVISGSDVFNKSVEVRLKKDEAVEVLVREKLQQIDITKDAEVIIFPMDISIYEKGTEIKVQPKEGTTVDIIVPIPDELQTYKDKLKVLCIIDNKLYVLPSMLVTEDGVKCVQFTAKHFSPYSFIVDLYGTLDGYVSEEDNSNDGDDSSTEITPTPVDNTETEEIDGNIPEDNGSTSGENPTKDSSSLEDGDLTNIEDNKREVGNSDQNNDSNNENKGNNDVLNEKSSDSSDTAIPKTGEQILIMVILGICAGGCIVFRYFIKNTKYNN